MREPNPEKLNEFVGKLVGDLMQANDQTIKPPRDRYTQDIVSALYNNVTCK